MSGLLIIAGAVFGIMIGAQGALAWTEIRHDCMPHDPERCRERARKTVSR